MVEYWNCKRNSWISKINVNYVLIPENNTFSNTYPLMINNVPSSSGIGVNEYVEVLQLLLQALTSTNHLQHHTPVVLV